MLILQSALTYLPCLVWKCLERGKMRRLLHRDSSIETISKFLYEHPGWFTESDALNFYFYCVINQDIRSISADFINRFRKYSARRSSTNL